MVSNVRPKKAVEISGWANKRWLAAKLGILPSSMEAFLQNNRRYLGGYRIKVQGLGVLYAVNAVMYLHSIPKGRDRWDVWKTAKPACPPLPILK
jgi:hypothetical protein